MGELRADTLASILESAAVVPMADNRFSGIEDAVDLDCKSVPLAAEPHKHTSQDCLRTDVGVAIGVGMVLGFPPFNLRIEGCKYRRHISDAECLIDGTNGVG